MEVAVPLPVHQTFHYTISSPVKTGCRVSVLFKNRKLHAFVLGFPKEAYDKAIPILDIVDETPLFSDKELAFYRWISTHYIVPLGEVIKAALPPLKFPKPRKKKIEKFVSLPSSEPQSLTSAQHQIVQKLRAALETGTYAPFLLHGVTGSGKTEVYIQLIRHTLDQKKQAIVLVPEISLTPQLVSRFEQRFPNQIAVLHSGLTASQRFQEWTRIKNGEVSIVIGARSAIFAPCERVGALIIDEEHDSSFKQEERVRYHARDLALVRGQLEKAVVVLGSATPSLESFYNVRIKKLSILTLPQRIDDQPLPTVEIVAAPPETFSETLLKALTETLHRKEQAILFLNRRGYSPFLWCETCGDVPKCSHCAVSLTVYSQHQKLICHYCGHTLPFVKTCLECKTPSLKPVGIGTEKVEEELKRYFPQARISRMDRSTIRKRNALETLLLNFAHRKIDILIGTQMVVKGHDFPYVTCVGVICADTLLHLPDFRASERTFQLLTQAAGRAGRGDRLGRVIIQTFNPEHASLRFAKYHDVEGFLKQELLERKEPPYPPFVKLIHFKTAHAHAEIAEKKLRDLLKRALKLQSSDPQFGPLEFLGPSPAPLSKIKDKYRFHLLLKSPSHHLSRTFMAKLLSQDKEFSRPPAIQIDVDPLNLL